MTSRAEIESLSLKKMQFKELSIDGEAKRPQVEIETEHFVVDHKTLVINLDANVVLEPMFELGTMYQMVVSCDDAENLENIPVEISYLVMSEVSLLLSTLTKATRSVPFVIDAGDLLSFAGFDDGRLTVNTKN